MTARLKQDVGCQGTGKGTISSGQITRGRQGTGDLILDNPSTTPRLQGGIFSGGGNIRVPNSGLNIVSRGATTISNPIVLNENNEPK